MVEYELEIFNRRILERSLGEQQLQQSQPKQAERCLPDISQIPMDTTPDQNQRFQGPEDDRIKAVKLNLGCPDEQRMAVKA